jgi:hypothetical protein
MTVRTVLRLRMASQIVLGLGLGCWDAGSKPDLNISSLQLGLRRI